MSLQSNWNEQVPEDTAQVGQAILSEDSPYRRVGDEVQRFLHLGDFATMYSIGGRGAICPIILSLVTIFQFLENIPDRVAAEWVVVRLDWKYALHVPLNWMGFHYSDLSNFRKRLLEHGQERLLFEKVLSWVRSHGFLRKHGKQRTDSTHVLGQVARLSRLELVWETLRKVLRAIEKEAPAWYSVTIPAAFHEVYSVRQSDWRLSQEEIRQKMQQAGADGYWLLDLLDTDAPPKVQDLSEVETLRTVLAQQYKRQEGKVVARKPPIKGKEVVVSPHETEARWAKKREQEWQGYKLHATETVVEKEEADRKEGEEDDASFITDIQTSAANDGDSEMVDGIQARLQQRGLRPKKHYVDRGYVSGANLAHSADKGTTLMGPALANNSPKPEGYRQSDFQIDFERQEATCPQGELALGWCERPQEDGYVGVNIYFRTRCDGCPERCQCTTSKDGRTLKVSPYHEHLEARRAEQQSEAFREEMKRRSAVEGTLSAVVRKHGARRARYRGQAKVHLQHLFTGAAVNVKRLTRALSAQRRKKLARATGC
jgi:transposase